jgi:putative Mg2+ transporter-C (MgtC) family protein
LVGSGFLVPAYLSTFAVISANLLARPLEKVFKQPDKDHQSLSSGNMKPVKNMKMILNMANERVLSTNTTDLAGVYPNHYQYCCNVLCFAENKILVFELINQFVRVHNLTLMRMQSKNVLSKTKSKRLEIEIKVNFTAKNRGLHKSNLEEIIKLLKTKAKVNSISLQLLPP